MSGILVRNAIYVIISIVYSDQNEISKWSEWYIVNKINTFRAFVLVTEWYIGATIVVYSWYKKSNRKIFLSREEPKNILYSKYA